MMGMPGAGFTGTPWGKAPSDRLALEPYWENPPYGILGGAMETSASFEVRSAPSSYPTALLAPGRAGASTPTVGNHIPARVLIRINDPINRTEHALNRTPWLRVCTIRREKGMMSPKIF